MLSLDHLVWTVPSLEKGIEDFERLTGVRAAVGGRHPGRGTCNALASLGHGAYLEIVAPDPTQALSGNYGEMLARRPHEGLITFVMTAPDMAASQLAAVHAGVPWQGPVPLSRQTPDGRLLEWRLAYTEGTEYGEWLPYYIDWQQTAHPATTSPSGLTLLGFEVSHPQADALHAIYAALGIDIPVRRAARPGMRALLSCPLGQAVLTSL